MQVCTVFLLKKHFSSLLETVVLINIFVETMIRFSEFFDEQEVQKNTIYFK